MKGTKGLRAALYARYSNDIQNDRSIERQIADLEKEAKRFGFILDKRHYYSDRAQSAQTLFDRPGLTRQLMGAAERGEIDVVLVEQTDRLAREEADLFILARDFKLFGVRIFTPGGEVQKLQLLFDAHTNADFVDKLRKRVRSGQDDAARQGRIPGKPAYGYDCVKGEPGVKVINQQEAAVLLRIAREYLADVSPRTIAADLMRDNIVSPSGTQFWNFQMISGGEGRARGLLCNQLYIGKYLRNRFQNVYNHRRGKTVTRKADPSALIEVDMPHLRIFPQELWDAVQAKLKERSHKKYAGGAVVRSTVPRKPHLLMGLIRCAECHTRMTITQTSKRGKRVQCAAAYNRQSCPHTKSYNLERTTAMVVARMEQLASDPEVLAETNRARQERAEQLRKSNNNERDTTQKRIDRIAVNIRHLTSALMALGEDDAPDEINAQLVELQRERTGLKERLKYLGSASNVIPHPRRATTMATNLAALAALVKASPDSQNARLAFGTLIEGVLVHANGELELVARDEAASADLGIEKTSKDQVDNPVCFSPAYCNEPDYTKQEKLLVSLGRWRPAA